MPTEKDIKDHWDSIWKKHNDKSQKIFEKFYQFFIRQPFSANSIYKIIAKKIKEKNYKNFNIIECGCGSGLIQKKLYEKFNCGTDFLDISPEALKYTKTCLKDSYNPEKQKFILGSILSIPIKDNQYEIVFNAGVLEHFNEEDQKKAISEMLRITKPGGLVIIFVPCVYGKIYMKMKARAEKNKTWKAGVEVPLKTMKHLIPKNLKLEEFSIGYVSQLHYLKYLFKNKLLINLSIPLLEILQRLLWFLEKRPGYFLVDIIEK